VPAAPGLTRAALAARSANVRRAARHGRLAQRALLVRELRRLGHRRPAHEAFADIDGRLPVDSALACEQRNALGGPERDDRVRLPGLERDARDLVLGGADDRELARRREVE